MTFAVSHSKHSHDMAHKSITTEIHILATPERVWRILTDLDRYPEWNPFITRASGQLAEGRRLSIQAGDMAFKPVVQVFRPDRELQWLGSLWFKGLFDGAHRFELIPQADGTTLLRHSEDFSGLLVGVLASKLDQDTRAGFEAMNEALKARAETMDVPTE